MEKFHLHFVAPIKIDNRFRMFDWGFLSQNSSNTVVFLSFITLLTFDRLFMQV